MDLGPATLFDLPATGTVQDAAARAAQGPVTRSAELLRGIGATQALIAEQEISKVKQIAEWAAQNTVDDDAEACTLTERGLDTGLPVAGPGAPLISDLAVMQLAAVLGRSLDSGRSYLGQVVELACRLPRLWDRVLQGRVPVWKALRVADTTRCLPAEAAAYLDRQLAILAAGMTWAQVDRLVEEALVRFDPAAAEERRREAQDARHLTLHLDQTGFDGTVHLTGVLDTADALDLDQALARRAKLLGQLGNTDSLDVRRSVAAGELARTDLALDLDVIDEDTAEITRTVPGRKVELVLHLHAAALGDRADEGTGPGDVGRLANTRTPISPEQVKAWTATPATTLIVRPVVDLAGHQHTGAYEIPDRIRSQVTTRDHHCVFPHCHRPAQRCDLDHTIPHNQGGPTCACNLAPLCRGHHRLKTTGQMTYRTLHPGTHHWTGPAGTWLVDPTGTHNLSPPPTPTHQ